MQETSLVNVNMIIEPEYWDDLRDESRVWIYQSNRKLTLEEGEWVNKNLQAFVSQWASHSVALMAKGKLLANTFIVLMVDESNQNASGCSIDSSVHFINQLNQHLNVNFMDRMTFSFLKEGQPSLLSREAFTAAYSRGEIKADTLVFDTLVNNKYDFLNSFIKPLEKSWHSRMI